MNRMLQWESVNELNAFRLLEANPLVREYHEQPATISYLLHGERKTHVPDILVHTKTDRSFWEVKPKDKASSPEVVERTKLLTEALPDHGYHYRMVIGEDLASQPRLANLKKLLRGRNACVSKLEGERVRQVFIRIHETTVGDLLAALGGSIHLRCIYRLIMDGELIVNLSEEINDLTLIHHAETCRNRHDGSQSS